MRGGSFKGAMMEEETDEQFLECLQDYLNRNNTGLMGLEPRVPIFKNTDGSLNRKKILQLPCFENFNNKQRSN